MTRGTPQRYRGLPHDRAGLWQWVGEQNLTGSAGNQELYVSDFFIVVGFPPAAKLWPDNTARRRGSSHSPTQHGQCSTSHRHARRSYRHIYTPHTHTSVLKLCIGASTHPMRVLCCFLGHCLPQHNECCCSDITICGSCAGGKHIGSEYRADFFSIHTIP